MHVEKQLRAGERLLQFKKTNLCTIGKEYTYQSECGLPPDWKKGPAPT